MSVLQKIAAALLAALLAAAVYGFLTTRPAPAPALPAAATPAGTVPVIDEETYRTAQRLARLATTAEEQSLAQSAVQIADRELDLAFAATLHYVESHPPVLSPEAAKIQDHLSEVQKQLDTDSASVKRLTAELAQASDADKAAVQDRLDLAQSQVELEQDELAQANDDLLQAGGNVHQRIQTMQQEHEATEHNGVAVAATPAPTALGTLKGMVGQVREWLSLRDKRRRLAQAERAVALSATQLTQERAKIAAELAASKAEIPELANRGHAAGPAPATTAAPAARPVTASPPQSAAAAHRAASPAASPSAPAGATGVADTPTLLTLTRQIAAEQHRLTLRDQRITARRRLADVYGQWGAVLAAQQRTILHACMQGASVVLLALILLLFTDRWLEHLLGRAPIDRRQLGTLRSVIGVALQIVALIVILLALIGMPGNVGTMLGLAGAGLTVALKDFIVAFIGWFVLMGRNGMRVGDWVEINGVSGEVVELGMFHTVLLETGNWGEAGQPTGRHVTFTNSFAIEGHYFNFSTSGQWLWDELSVMVPYGRDPQMVAEAIQKQVLAETAQSTAQAEQEWRRAARGQRGASFSVQPAIAVRPASGGVEIAVRYVTRASERFALRARLNQTAVQLLAQPSAAGAAT
jgi:small-conductance mechanosensitive channel